MASEVYSTFIVEDIKRHLDDVASKYVTYPKFVFLCGKGIDSNQEDSYTKSNRGIIDAYLSKLNPDIKIVLSERIWEDAFDENIDLLTFEEFLAEVSDAIILFVESPGSFCELGAFTYANNLFSDKLIIVMDEKYKDSKSFISTGPVLKAKEDGSQIIYAKVNDGALLDSSDLRRSILDLVRTFSKKQSAINKREINKESEKVYISSFIIEMVELLKLVEPISKSDLIALYKRVKGFDSFTLVKRDASTFNREIKLHYIWKLLSEAKIISEDKGIISLNDANKSQSFMLNYQGKSFERQRSRIICRKYRYGEKV